MNKKIHPAMGLFLFMLMVSLACRLPFMPKEISPTLPETALTAPVAETTFVEPEVQAAEPLPPAIVEVDPIAGSTIAPDQRFLFYFNQPMLKESVETRLTSDLQAALEFDWIDDSTLAVSFSEDMPLDRPLSITFGEGIQAVNGLSTDSDLAFSYQTAGPLLLADLFPAPAEQSFNPRGVIMVAFNQPVVALGLETDLSAFTLSPDTPGTGEWLNTSTYIFRADPALAGGVEYTLTLNEDLRSLLGAALQLGEGQTQEWTFTTASPLLVTLEPLTRDPIPLDSDFVLTFNQPMDPVSVEQNLTLEDANGQVVPGFVSWDETFTILTFTSQDLLARSTSYQLRLGAEGSSAGGTPLGKVTRMSFETVGRLAVASITPSLQTAFDIFSGYASLQINFNAPLADTDFESLVEFQPALIDPSFYLAERDTLVVSGFFRGGTTYTMSVSNELEDEWGQALETPYQTSFITTPSRAQLNIPLLQYGEQVLFMTPSDKALPAQATNLTGVDVRSAPLQLPDFVRLATERELLLGYTPNVGSESWRQDLNLSAEINQSVELRVTPNGDSLEPGLYSFLLQANALEYDIQPFLVVVSNLHMVIKRSEGQLFVWVVDLRNGEVFANAALQLIVPGMDSTVACVTDTDGRCSFEIPAEAGPFDPVFVVHAEPGDEDFGLGLDGWWLGVNGWDFGLQTYRTRQDTMAYLYSDRAIYRPGQTVNFRVVVRDAKNARYTLADLGQVQVEVYGDYQVATGEVPLLDTIPVSLSSFGSGSAAFTLPDNAPPGYYSLRVLEIEDSLLNFQVAEYRKPEIELSVQFDSSQMLQGEDLLLEAQADYYFGVPAEAVPLRWALYVQPDYFELPFGYQTGQQDFSWLEQGYWRYYSQPLGAFVAEGEGQTDGDGRFLLRLPYAEFKESLDPDAIQRLNLEMTIIDDSERPVSARGNMLVHPEHYYIGVRPENWLGTAGVPLGFAIQTADWEKSAMASVSLSAELQKIRWIRVEDPVSGMPKSTPEYLPVSSVDLMTDSSGQARIEMTPEEPGTYMLSVSGGQSKTQILIWVAGTGSASWPNIPNQQLPVTPDSDSYQVGETATLFAPNPFDKAIALITVERASVMRSFVMIVDKPQIEFPLQIQPEDAPNIYVGITLLSAGMGGEYDFRQGYLNLNVDPGAHTLQIELQVTGEKPEPGGEMIVSLRANDQTGSPVEGEFSLALIDKAVLALAEPNTAGIVEAFYGIQPLGVQTSVSLAAYVQRFPRPVADGIGGGGGAELMAPYVRDEFRDTAFWNGSIQTDADGRADVRIDLPDNLTTWVATVRGLTPDTRVGEAQTEVIVSKDLLVRPVTPRFLVTGDVAQFGAIVHNNTTESLPVDVSLQISGLSLDSDSPELQRIILNPGESYRVNWHGTVQSVEQVEMVFSAQAGELSDAAVPEGGAIPVLHYSTPQTFGTSGILVDQNEILEVVSLPLSYHASAGQLKVELAPSLAAAILEDMQVFESYPDEMTEPLVSRLLPNLEMLRAIELFGLATSDLKEQLSQEIRVEVDRLSRIRNSGGGWGWRNGAESNTYITSYVLFGLSRAAEQGFFIESSVIEQTQDYLLQALPLPSTLEESWQLDRLVFQYFALFSSGLDGLQSSDLEGYSDRLNPWSRALLALMETAQHPGNESVSTALNDLQSMAEQTASGVHWSDSFPAYENYSSTILNSAVVLYTLAKLDPASSLLPGGVRYLVAHRRVLGGWSSSYETAWSLVALIEVMLGTGELQSDFSFSALLNGQELMSGKAQGVDQITAVYASAPLSDLLPESPNALRIRKDAGQGRLYYRAYLQADRPVEEVPPLNRGLSVQRRFSLWDEGCDLEGCPEILEYSLEQLDAPVLVRITLAVPEEMFYVVVEDWIPAGAEIVDTSLLTTQQGLGKPQDSLLQSPDLFSASWENWYFGQPQVYDDHIRWVAEWLPAGTYDLTYRMTPYLMGTFRVIPARAYQYYFPEVEGTSAGSIFTID